MRGKSIFALIAVFMLSQVVAQEIPVALPAPDQTLPAKDKPVKVYILSGQSNMVGFGRVGGASPTYPSIFLSADPSVMPCKMPVGSSALLPHLIYQDEKGEVAGAKAYIYEGAYDANADYSAMKPVKETAVPLGTVTENLPAVEGPHTVIVKAFIEVPITGMHNIHAGFGDSTHAIVKVDGQEVYRKDIVGKEKLTKIKLEKGKRYPVTITYLKGGSAAFWMELVDLKGMGDLETLVKKDGLFPFLIDKDGNWTVRNDVVLCESYLDRNKFKGGRSTALTATANNGKHIGPELGFGYVMGTFHDEPVLLIKADIGNRSLGWDYLAPGSERFEAEVTDTKTGEKKTYIFAGYKDSPDKWLKGTDPKPINWYAGKQYDECTQAIHGVLNNFDTLYPQFKDQGHEIAGFVWWQGHKDQNPVHASRYEQNMINLMKAWRKEFNAPDAKWVLATIAFGGWDLGEPGVTIANAQLAVDGDSGKHPENKGNVKTIEARDFWRKIAESPTDAGYHYNHNAETYILVGDALGRAMVELMGGKAEKRPIPPKPKPINKKASDKMTLEEAAQFVYTDAFISQYRKRAAKPTKEQIKAMSPMILGGLVPAYAASASGIPRHLRAGMSIVPIVTGKLPIQQQLKPKSGLTTQLDKLISYYNFAGVHNYDWKPFGPDMRNEEWDYYSFDPPEKQEISKDQRYRKITYPDGMENWFKPEFDAKSAGWKTGKAPFGQNDGKLAPLSSSCNLSDCGCGATPNTLWEKEVLLMRQTFELPELKDDYRYRLIFGGSAHAFSGEGYAIYVNGKLFSEEKAGHNKGKGGARGGYIFEDFLPEFKKGKVTIAVKSFLRYTGNQNELSPPRGHVSVWLEQVKLPDAVVSAVENIKK